ncbi:MAG: methyltransferase domain-containing protein [Solirubrobacteraceae bacterium]|nr:methyltransferase domain-containing protein [Solirubrobacteraceae bacterium]
MTPITADPTAVAELKAQHHDTWADGDYPAVAEHIADALPTAILDAVDVRGHDLLDVATGSGNVAIAAARAGAHVTGLDLVDDLLDAARRRAAAAGLRIAWQEGDAEALPYGDDSFDVVTSAVGVQFAPRAEVVAGELRRVCRPGGAIVLCNWTKEGLIGQLFTVMSQYMPAAPPFVTGPPKWGDEAFLRQLFAGDDVTITRGHNPFAFATVEEYMTFFEVNYGPTKRAKAKLQAEGRWDDLRADLRSLYTGLNQATDGSLHIEAEFLVATVKPGA